MIPDDFLPAPILEAEGGAKRRRSSVTFMEVVGLENDRYEPPESTVIIERTTYRKSYEKTRTKIAWRKPASATPPCGTDLARIDRPTRSVARWCPVAVLVRRVRDTMPSPQALTIPRHSHAALGSRGPRGSASQEAGQGVFTVFTSDSRRVIRE